MTYMPCMPGFLRDILRIVWRHASDFPDTDFQHIAADYNYYSGIDSKISEEDVKKALCELKKLGGVAYETNGEGGLSISHVDDSIDIDGNWRRLNIVSWPNR
jgi:hypothetical protein